MITRKALDVLHQKCNFVGNVNRNTMIVLPRQAQRSAPRLNVRMPSKYGVRTGASLSAQNHVERSTPLTVSSQYGVDVSFTSVELTMNLDDFSERIIEPAMAQLAAKIESTALTAAYKLVNNYTNATTDGLLTYKRFQQGGANITNELAPMSQRSAILSPDSQVEFNDAVKGLFQSQENIRKQYREGLMGRTGGFDVYENTLLPSHTTGNLSTAAVLDGSDQGTSDTSNVWVSQTTLSINGVTADTINAGDIITINNVYSVHPETKVSTGKLKTFVCQTTVTLTTAATTYAVTVKPGLIYGSGNAYQNCYLSGAETDDMTWRRSVR